jgi:hypothetical protein
VTCSNSSVVLTCLGCWEIPSEVLVGYSQSPEAFPAETRSYSAIIDAWSMLVEGE